MRTSLEGLRIALAIAFAAVVMAAAVSFAARNSAGSYSLPSPGVPFQAGTTISTSQMNATLSDLGSEIGSSLDRAGRGGMLAAFRGIDGTVAAPAYSFTSEPATGFYRIGASDLGLALGGVKTHEWVAAGETVTGTLGVSGASTLTGNVGIGAAPLTPLYVRGGAVSGAAAFTGVNAYFDSNASQYIQMASPNASFNGILFGDVASNTRGQIVYFNSTSATGFADQMQFFTNGSLRGHWNNGGLTIGSSGIAISGSFRGTAAFSPGTIGANTCGSVSVTVTGATQGSECLVGLPGGAGSLQVSCEITGANTCAVNFCNTTGIGITPITGNVACRAFNP